MDDDIMMPFGPPDFTDEGDKIWIETAPETFNHPAKLWTSYWKRFNTIVIPLQSASSYFTDALAAAREAETREELEALLAAKYKERADELSRAVRAIGDGWQSHLSPHAQDAVFDAGNQPCLETFAELYYNGILAAEGDSKAVEEFHRAQTFDDDADDDAGQCTEEEDVSPVEVGDDEPSVRSTPPRCLFRQQWSDQSLDGDSAVDGEDVGNEPTPEDAKLPQFMDDGWYMDQVDVGDETGAEDAEGAAYCDWPEPWVETVGSRVEISYEYLGDGEETGAAATAGDDVPGANKKRRRSEDSADEDQGDGPDVHRRRL
ncbi:hypothetical protein MAPG_10853 [Magnaporthiopsis poae ATCC 64411]|uniref:Uncharacterized protein n=1 Tax=Magnaporthiopsis poae (strain ATCC 64411 / 73-15) TaxID=644358 RepID=A0A0C4EDP7_MAGP6|nr:hypothetical protein MAPG_10853 [Magnaporthiopsis poae ATCC 64411]